MYICIYTYIYIYTYVCMYVYIYIYISIYYSELLHGEIALLGRHAPIQAGPAQAGDSELCLSHPALEPKWLRIIGRGL